MTDPIVIPFNAESTAADVVAGVDLSGKRAIVTGGSSGIGIETARALASAGAKVTLAVRTFDQSTRSARCDPEVVEQWSSTGSTVTTTATASSSWSGRGSPASDRATGVSYCLAHHLTENPEG